MNSRKSSSTDNSIVEKGLTRLRSFGRALSPSSMDPTSAQLRLVVEDDVFSLLIDECDRCLAEQDLQQAKVWMFWLTSPLTHCFNLNLMALFPCHA